MRKIEEIIPLKIALVAWNRDVSLLAAKDFINNNKEQVKYFHNNVIKLMDDTEIRLVNYLKEARGVSFDQIIICDDYRWNVLEEKDWFIRELRLETAWRSCVPEEHQVLKYEF